MPICGLCHAVLSTIAPMQCSRCRNVHYCSQACQRADWPGHKVACAAAVDYETALALFDGRDCAKDDAESLRLLVGAAKSGNADAQCELGRRYDAGVGGVNVNGVLAAHWHRKAAEAGNVYAQCSLGTFFYNGRGVEKDSSAAALWFNKAAEAGHVKAQFNLGMCYAYGTGVEKDTTAAVHWYRKAAEAGDSYAQCRLGTCYELGTGVEKDVAIAVHWYRKAAEAGDVDAQFLIGECYELGRGVEQDLAQAVHWYGIASSTGDSNAVARLATLRVSGYVGSDEPATAADEPDEPATALPPLVCAAVGCTEPGLLACSRCRAALYCSQACQRAHRRAHKEDCDGMIVPAVSSRVMPAGAGGSSAGGDLPMNSCGGSASSH
jgi:TPR repeat protein